MIFQALVVFAPSLSLYLPDNFLSPSKNCWENLKSQEIFKILVSKNRKVSDFFPSVLRTLDCINFCNLNLFLELIGHVVYDSR